jgi:hypothetical protein
MRNTQIWPIRLVADSMEPVANSLVLSAVGQFRVRSCPAMHRSSTQRPGHQRLGRLFFLWPFLPNRPALTQKWRLVRFSGEWLVGLDYDSRLA